MTALPAPNGTPPVTSPDLQASISHILEPLEEVQFAIVQNDWNRLRALSLQPGGFGVEGRKEAWPYLLHATGGAGPSSKKQGSPELTGERSVPQENGTAEEESLDYSSEDISESIGEKLGESVVPHPDERQVGLDTDRSFVMYPADNVFKKSSRKTQLHELIVGILRKRRKLSYFQGFHDVISVLYLTLDDSDGNTQADSTNPSDLLLKCGENISLHRLRDAMGSGLEPIVGNLRILQRLFRVADPELAEIIEQTSPLPYFALSNLLTLFSHDVPTLPLIQRIFDYLLCRPPIYNIYLAAAIVLSRKADILKLEAEGEDGMMHSILSQLPTLVADGEDERELEPKPQSTPRMGRNTSISHSTTIIPSSRQSRERSSSRPPKEPQQPETDSESTNKLNGVKERKDILSEDDEHPTSARAPSPDPSETRSTVATTLADATSRATTPFPDHRTEKADSPSEVDEKASLRASSSSSTRTEPNGIPISTLLRAADELYEKYPPSHPTIAANTIMGPNSVIFTWRETEAGAPCLPSDDEAEDMVEDKSSVVLPYDPMDDMAVNEDEPPKHLPVARRRSSSISRLVKSLEAFMKLEKRVILAGLIVVIAIGYAYQKKNPDGVKRLVAAAAAFLGWLTEIDDFLDLAGDSVVPGGD